MSNNTATRWWVRMAARWMARVQTVQGQLSLLFQGMSGVGIASGAMKYLGAPTWAVVGFAVIFTVFVIAYIYYYAEKGVHNQKNRDLRDIGNNFAGPNARIVTEMTARGWLAGRKGEALTERERDAIAAELDAAFTDYRDGVELPEDER